MAEKIAKGVKKAAKASYNVVIGDDIRTLTSKNTKWYQKVVSGALIAANFIPVVGPAASVTAKVAIKGTVATVKAVKTTSSAKKVATAANKTPKTVAAKSIKSTPKIQESKSVTANNVTPQAPPKVNLTKQPDRNNTSIRLKASEDTTKSIGNVGHGEEISKDIVNINKKYSSGFEQNNSITNIVNSASYC